MRSFSDMTGLGGRPLAETLQLVAAALLTAAVFVQAPILSLVVLIFVAGFIGTPSWRFLMISGALLLFVFINITKVVDGDLLNYIALQSYFQGRGPDVLFGRLEMTAVSGSYRISELGYYAPAWLLANLVGAPRTSVAVFGTLAVYLPVVAAVASFKRTSNWDERQHTLVLLIMLMASINFVQTTHLLRQYISAGFGLLAYARFLEGRKASGSAMLLIGCTAHNALAPVSADVIVVGWLVSKGIDRGVALRWRVAAIFAAVLVFVVSFAIVPLAFGLNSIAEGMTLKLGHYVVIGGVLFLSAGYAAINEGRVKCPPLAIVISFMIVLTSFGFFVIKTSILALRYFAYVEWLIPLLVAPLVGLFPSSMRAQYVVTRWLLCAAAVSIFVWRVGVAPWIYGPGEFDIFSASAMRLLEFFGE